MIGISDEFEESDFGDKRLNKRLKSISEAFVRNSENSIPESFEGWSETKSAYRFMSNPKITREEILRSHTNKTVERVKEHDTILAVQDTTSLDFTRHKNTKGLGYLDEKNSHGIMLHTTLAVTEEGRPFGIISQQSWIREIENLGKSKRRRNRPFEEKESSKWIKAIEETESIIPDNVHVITVGDRESDISDLIFRERPSNSDYIVRTYHDRVISETKEKMYETLEKEDEASRITLDIANTSSRKGRKAVLSIRFKQFEIEGTYRWKGKKTKVTAIIVNEEEVSELKEKERPLNWLLITSMLLEKTEDVIRAINIYRTRWIIERFHYTLKSGCKVENLQLEERQRLEVAIAIYDVVAWFLLWLTYLGREFNEKRSLFFLDEREWKILYKMANKDKPLPDEPPTINEIVYMLGRIGGFIGRKSDGYPGVKTIWQGLIKLLIVLEYADIFSN
ncbi:MAG: IS4 family transposase [Mesotoga sp.]|nr:IS4 family transposase [Mesotoga sp.]NLT44455.1 IS4 family transposase [Thermotogaceae bacterium]